jgi:hypothetical protein
MQEEAGQKPNDACVPPLKDDLDLAATFSSVIIALDFIPIQIGNVARAAAVGMSQVLGVPS